MSKSARSYEPMSLVDTCIILNRGGDSWEQVAERLSVLSVPSEHVRLAIEMAQEMMQAKSTS